MKRKLVVTLVTSLLLGNSLNVQAAPVAGAQEKTAMAMAFAELSKYIDNRINGEWEPQYEKVTMYAQSAVNVRNKPSTKGKVVKAIERGTKVTVISTEDGWYRTSAGNFIKANYLSEEKPPSRFYNVTDEERYWLYQLTYAEAGSQSYQCRKYIASVVFNLRADSRYPNTIMGVIFNGNAFSPTLDGSIYNKVPDESTKQAVDEVIKYGPVTSALYFEADYCHSTWHAQQTFLEQVDHVLFYK